MNDRLSRASLWQAVCAAVLGVGLVTAVMGIRGLIPYWDARFADYDHNAYLAMAQEGIGAPGRASTPPFCWRILTPWIAGALPLPAPLAFFLLSFVLLSACTLAVYVMLRRRGVPHTLSLAGEISFLSYFWAVGFNMWNYLMVDALSLLLLIVGLIVLEEEWPAAAKLAAMSALLTLGALNKESYLLLASAAFVYFLRTSSAALPWRLLRALLPAIPPVAVMLLVRHAIIPDPGQRTEFPSYDLLAVFTEMLRGRLGSLPQWAAEVLVDPWGPLVLVPFLLRPADALKWARVHLHLVVFAAGAVAQTFFGTSGGRLAIMAAPVAILYTVDRLERHLGDAGFRRGPVTILLTLQFIFQYLRRTTFGLGVPPYAPHPWVTAAYAVRSIAFAAFLAAWMFFGRRAPAGGAAPPEPRRVPA